MREYNLNKLISNKEFLEEKLREAKDQQLFTKQAIDEHEIAGHLAKADHNLRFTNKIIKEEFFDWALVGTYYACYHAALALILTKGYTSKSHIATIYILIKEFYKKIDKEDIALLDTLLDYEDVLFYTQAKQEREKATYTTTTTYNKVSVEQLRIQATLFVNKIKEQINP